MVPARALEAPVVPTPVRNTAPAPGKGSVYRPEHAPIPPKEPDDLSPGAIDKRLRRLMARRADGSRLIPEELYEEWKNLETRDGVLRQFEMCGWSRETSLKSGLLLSNLKFLIPTHATKLHELRTRSSKKFAARWSLCRKWKSTSPGSS